MESSNPRFQRMKFAGKVDSSRDIEDVHPLRKPATVVFHIGIAHVDFLSGYGTPITAGQKIYVPSLSGFPVIANKEELTRALLAIEGAKVE